MTHTLRRSAAIVLAAGLAVACQEVPPGPADATIFFQLDAPLCSSTLPVQFTIDGILVATDTFQVSFGPGDITSAPFHTAAGSHVLAARVVGGYVWPDTTVTLLAGAVFTRSLPFYCS